MCGPMENISFGGAKYFLTFIIQERYSFLFFECKWHGRMNKQNADRGCKYQLVTSRNVMCLEPNQQVIVIYNVSENNHIVSVGAVLQMMLIRKMRQLTKNCLKATVDFEDANGNDETYIPPMNVTILLVTRNSRRLHDKIQHDLHGKKS